MREGTIDLTKQEIRMINNMLETTTKNVTEVFNATCKRILSRRGIEDYRAPFEVVIGCGGLSTTLRYWSRD